MMLFARAQACCELCGRDLANTREYSKHHRRPRGMGGTLREWVNQVANLLLVCGTGTTGCHHRIESNRTHAYDMGWLLRHSDSANEIPVEIFGRGLVYLTDDGAYADGAP